MGILLLLNEFFKVLTSQLKQKNEVSDFFQMHVSFSCLILGQPAASVPLHAQMGGPRPEQLSLLFPRIFLLDADPVAVPAAGRAHCPGTLAATGAVLHRHDDRAAHSSIPGRQRN